jgi:glycosyltransferase involved in cell wall biosynthesis
MKPLVSILIPAYNARQWIAETIESALAQTWPKREIIVVDDGSSDETLRIATRYASHTVKVVTQANQGASVARNTAFSICQGDYIQWLDADDLLEPDKIARQAQWLDDGASRRTLLSGAWGSFIYRKRKARFSPTPLWSDLTPLDWLVRKMGSNLHMQTDNWLVSRELTEAAGPWDARLWRDNDGEYFCRVIVASGGIKFVPDAKSYYRAAGFKSVSYIGGSNKKLESLFLSMKLHMRYLRSMEDSEETRSACRKYIGTWVHEFYPYRPDIVQQLKAMVAELGGEFQEPRLSWKYDWIVRCAGWHLGRRAHILMPKLKRSVLVGWDRMMSELEERTQRHRQGLAHVHPRGMARRDIACRRLGGSPKQGNPEDT